MDSKAKDTLTFILESWMAASGKPFPDQLDECDGLRAAWDELHGNNAPKRKETKKNANSNKTKDPVLAKTADWLKANTKLYYKIE